MTGSSFSVCSHEGIWFDAFFSFVIKKQTNWKQTASYFLSSDVLSSPWALVEAHIYSFSKSLQIENPFKSSTSHNKSNLHRSWFSAFLFICSDIASEHNFFQLRAIF